MAYKTLASFILFSGLLSAPGKNITDDKGKVRDYPLGEIVNTFSFEEAVNLLAAGRRDSEAENDPMRAI